MSPWWLVLVAVLATIAVGAVVAYLVELRLRAMRELFQLSLVQRESFDNALRAQGGRIDVLVEADKNRVARLENHEERLQRLEGRRLT